MFVLEKYRFGSFSKGRLGEMAKMRSLKVRSIN